MINTLRQISNKYRFNRLNKRVENYLPQIAEMLDRYFKGEQIELNSPSMFHCTLINSGNNKIHVTTVRDMLFTLGIKGNIVNISYCIAHELNILNHKTISY